QGRCQTQMSNVNDFIDITSDGTFDFGVVTADACPGAPPIRGQWRSTRRQTIRLRGTNVRDWWDAFNRCSTSGVTIHGRRFSGTMNTTAGTLRVVQPSSSTVRGIFVSVRIVGRFTIVPADGSAAG